MLMRVFRCNLLSLSVLVMLLTGCAEEKSAAPETLTGAEALLAEGNQKSRMCMGCHGPKGISRVASYPSLAGQTEAYLTEQLYAFRSGTRENPMMSSIAKNLADGDIKALAAYYASQAAANTGSESVTGPEEAQ